MTKTSINTLVFALVLAVVLPIAVLAKDNAQRVMIKVDAGKVVDGNYYAVGSNILIEGHVTGDLLCAAESVEVKGEVDGDVLCAAQTLIISGKVHGSIRSIGSAISVENEVGRNLMVAAGNLIIGPKAKIGMDTLFWASRVNHLGSIGGSMRGAAYQVFLAGSVAEDVSLTFEDYYSETSYQPLIIQAKASIGGDLKYKSQYSASFAKRQSIAGRVLHEQTDPRGSMTESFMRFWIWSRILAIFGALIIGLAAVTMFRKPTMALVDRMIVKPWRLIGWGSLVTALIPLLAIFLVMTIVGIPVAFIIMLLWTVAIMVAKPLAAIMIGYVLIGRYRHKPGDKKARREIDEIKPAYIMALGVIVAYALMAVPFFGTLLAILFSAWVIGAVWIMYKESRAVAAK